MRQIHPSAWFLVFLSAVLQVLIFPLPDLSFLCWLAFAPLVVALLKARPAGELETDEGPRLQAAKPWQAFLLAYSCGILWYAGTGSWIYKTMRQYGGMSAVLALLTLLLFCLYLALYHGLFGLLIGFLARPKRDHRLALVSAPFLWVGVELARTRITGFPWNLLGIAQVDNAALCRIAGVTGVYGISFEIILVNVALAAAFLVPRKKRASLLFASLASAAALQAGQLIPTPAPSADRTAVLVQQNIPVVADWTRDYFDDTVKNLIDLTLRSSVAGAANLGASSGGSRGADRRVDLIVWPESPAPFYTSDPTFRLPVSGMAVRAQAWVVSGAIGTTSAMEAIASGGQGSEFFNSAALISPQGQWMARYDKVHLVPFGEYLPFPKLFSFAGGLTRQVGEFSRGSSREPLAAGNEQLGVFICYESIFPDEVRQFAKNGAQVFVNISNDGWYGDSGAYAQHLNQTRMRAIENSRWLLSATDTGVTASIDPWGRIVARIPRKQRAALVAPYALTSVTTFYTRHGDWFAYACAIISAGALVRRFAFSKTRKEADHSS